MITRRFLTARLCSTNGIIQVISNADANAWMTVADGNILMLTGDEENPGIGLFNGSTCAHLSDDSDFHGTVESWTPDIGAVRQLPFVPKVQNPTAFTFESPADLAFFLKTAAAAESEADEPSSSASDESPLPKNLILYGPPGTGKTFRTAALAVQASDLEFFRAHREDRSALKSRFDELRIEGRIGFVTFHPGFAYEEFIEGIAAGTEEGRIVYRVKDGVFKRFCLRAAECPDKPFVFIIDEINRGNVARIFGEIITLIESTKRTGETDSVSTTLPYSKAPFSVPSNVYLFGTMNTADRSLAALDTALRRRFEFVEIAPDPSLLDGVTVEGLDIRAMVEVINARIAVLVDPDHQLGVSYFLPLKDEPTLERLGTIFKKNILPLLSEYFYDDLERVGLVLNDPVKPEAFRFVIRKHASSVFIGDVPPGVAATKCRFNPAATALKEAYALIMVEGDRDDDN